MLLPRVVLDPTQVVTRLSNSRLPFVLDPTLGRAIVHDGAIRVSAHAVVKLLAVYGVQLAGLLRVCLAGHALAIKHTRLDRRIIVTRSSNRCPIHDRIVVALHTRGVSP